MNSQQPKPEMSEKQLNNQGIHLFTAQLYAHFWQCAPLNPPLLSLMRVTILDQRGALPVLEGLAVITGKQGLERLVREMAG